MAAEYRYDAFISYRHISPDKPIAERLQKLLESYVPPKDLRSGFRKMHLFRDETELPTSNDLGGDIKSALEQSRFLIVICSPALEKSKWCMQEIDYFRSLHGNTNRQILTLLVNDPDQPPVFPEPLRYEPRLIKTEDGAEKEVLEEVEPLAANVSAKTLSQSLKKLKTEFLRIAAPLLGCGFDDLYNREQRRRNRRRLTVSLTAAAVLAVAAVLSTTALITISSQKTQIEADAKELRRSNSELLLRESEMLESSGDLYGALDAVVKAQADCSDDQPASNGIVSQTASLTGAYLPELFTAVKQIDFPSKVTDLCLLDGGRRLAVVTSNGASLWDTGTGESVRSLAGSSNRTAFYRCRVLKELWGEQYAKGIVSQTLIGSVPVYTTFRKMVGEETPDGESAMYVSDWTRGAVERISPEDGSSMWSVPLENASFSNPDLISAEGVPVHALDELYVLDPATGATIASIGTDTLKETFGFTHGDTFYLNGHLFLCEGTDGSFWLAVYRKEGDTFRFLYRKELTSLAGLGSASCFVREGTVFVAGYVFTGVLDECTVFFQAYDLESGEQKWSYDAVTNTSGDPFIGCIEPSEKSANPFPVVFAAVGDRFFAVNAQTGSLIHNELLPGETESIYYSENGFVFMESQEGLEYFTPLRRIKGEGDTLNLFRSLTFPCETPAAEYANNLYAVTLGKEFSVVLYRTLKNDRKDVVYQLDDEEDRGLSEIIFSPDDNLAAISQPKPNELVVVSMETKEVLMTLPFGENYISSYSFAGNGHLAVKTSDAMRIYEIPSGKVVGELSKEEFDLYDAQVNPDSGEILAEMDKELYSVLPGQEPAVAFDPAAEMENVDAFYFTMFTGSPSGKRLFFNLHYRDAQSDSFAYKDELFLYDRNEKTLTVMKADGDLHDLSRSDVYVWSQDETELYLLKDNTVYGFDCQTGQQLFCVEPAVEAVDLVLLGSDLCLLNKDGMFTQIRAEGSELTELKSCSLTDSTVASKGLRVCSFSDGRLFLLYQNTGWQFDPKNFEVVSRIDYCCGVSEARNAAYTKYYNYFYSYPLQDAGRLLERAKHILQGG